MITATPADDRVVVDCATVPIHTGGAEDLITRIAWDDGKLWAFVNGFGSADKIVRIEPTTARAAIVWQRAGRMHFRGDSLAVLGGRAFFPEDDGMHAVDLASGQETLIFLCDVPKWCGVQRVGDLLVTVDNDRGLLWFDAAGHIVQTTRLDVDSPELFPQVARCAVLRYSNWLGQTRLRAYSPPDAFGIDPASVTASLPQGGWTQQDVWDLGGRLVAVGSEDMSDQFWIRDKESSRRSWSDHHSRYCPFAIPLAPELAPLAVLATKW